MQTSPHSTVVADPLADPDLWLVYCDGSAVPNPGRMAIGAVMTAPDGARHTLSQATHSTGCNNEAELLALLAALQALKTRGATSLRVHTDNSVLVEQLSGSGAKPILRLAGLFDDARALLLSFADARLVWVPRHRNAEADALARAAQGLAPTRLARAKKRRR